MGLTRDGSRAARRGIRQTAWPVPTSGVVHPARPPRHPSPRVAGVAGDLWRFISAVAAKAGTLKEFAIADGPIAFDSGELGTGGPPTAERTTWSVPTDLPEGTYTYFCRIHPLMRGAFRVEGEPVDGASTTTGG